MTTENLPTSFVQTQPITPTLDLPAKHNFAAKLVALGYKGREICSKIGMSESQFYVISRSPLFKLVVKEELDKLGEGVRVAQNTLMDAAPKAAETLVNLIDELDRPYKEAEARLDEGAPLEEVSKDVIEQLKARDMPAMRFKKDIALDVLKGAGAFKGESRDDKVVINVSDSKMQLIFETLRELK
jgi:hypothetical protein